MKKISLICMLLFSICWMPTTGAHEGSIRVQYTDQCDEKRITKIYSSYVASLLASGCVGAATGGALRYLEKQLKIQTSSPIAVFLVLLGWALESEFRNDIVVSLQRDLDMYQIGHKKGLMFKGAWIASWLAYLQM